MGARGPRHPRDPGLSRRARGHPRGARMRCPCARPDRLHEPEAAYAIAPTVGGRYRLSGRLRAEVSQACVVTLEPIDSTIEEELRGRRSGRRRICRRPRRRSRYRRRSLIRSPSSQGRSQVGRVVFESLAAAIDPFPSKPDAALDWQLARRPRMAVAGKPESPFAVLANIKTRTDETGELARWPCMGWRPASRRESGCLAAATGYGRSVSGSCGRGRRKRDQPGLASR